MATEAIARTRLRQMRRKAMARPWDGQSLPPDDQRWLTTGLTEPHRPTSVLFTFEFGAHGCGWWRNSDYDRCQHLSVTHLTGLGHVQAPTDAEVRAWARAAFGKYVVWTWTEPPASTLDPYRLPGVAHVRLFLDKQDHPILPEGEVYTLKPWTDDTSPEKVFR